MRYTHLLTIRKYEKFVPPCQNGQQEGGIGIGRGGISRWGYGLAMEVGCGVGLCWNIGEACRS